MFLATEGGIELNFFLVQNTYQCLTKLIFISLNAQLSSPGREASNPQL